jgi:hypothetical protein
MNPVADAHSFSLQHVSVDFIPPTTGPIAFEINFATGSYAPNGASSGFNPFTENGHYVYSDFSITDLSAAVPEPSTWAMMLLGFAGPGFAFRQSGGTVSFA